MRRLFRGRAARVAPLGLVAAGVCFLTAACAPAPKPKTHTVLMENLKFEPATLHVKAGDTIVWVNKDMFPHTATAKPDGFDSGEIGPGASWTLVVDGRGERAYVCTYHPTMTGKLVVE
jgi:plastocyanin